MSWRPQAPQPQTPPAQNGAALALVSYEQPSGVAAAAAGAATPLPATAILDGPPLLLVDLEVARTAEQRRAMADAELDKQLRMWLRLESRPHLQHGLIDLPTGLVGTALYVRCDLDGTLHDQEQQSAGGALSEAAAWASIEGVDPLQADVHICYYILSNEEEQDEQLLSDEGADEEEAPVSGGRSLALPHVRFDNLWSNLYYPYAAKCAVLGYAETALEMALCRVPADIVNCNRIVLLHGPPGTGKTTLCKAIAQKLSIRLLELQPAPFSRFRFMEVNAHALFSKWFSESGKLVQKLFEGIKQQLDDDRSLFYFILIDEVESLASSRAHGGNDPQDAVRAGNAVLTQLDRLKRYPNVLVLCTSNLTDMIDEAFSDRVDIKQYIGPPGVEARYEILCAQVTALLQQPRTPSGGVLPTPPMLANDVNVTLPLLSYRQLWGALAQQRAETVTLSGDLLTKVTVCQRLHDIAAHCENAGGRLLRRAPLRCCSAFKLATRHRVQRMSLSQFLQHLPDAIADEQATGAHMHRAPQQIARDAAHSISPRMDATPALSPSAMSATPAPSGANGAPMGGQTLQPPAADVNMQ